SHVALTTLDQICDSLQRRSFIAWCSKLSIELSTEFFEEDLLAIIFLSAFSLGTLPGIPLNHSREHEWAVIEVVSHPGRECATIMWPHVSQATRVFNLLEE